MQHHDDIDMNRIATQLRERAAELTAQSEGARESRAPVELDQQSVGRLSRMDAMQIQAMARESERRRLDEIQAIRTTLNRIAAGEYRYCVGCGERIAPARLVLIPTTGTCVDCADRAG